MKGPTENFQWLWSLVVWFCYSFGIYRNLKLTWVLELSNLDHNLTAEQLSSTDHKSHSHPKLECSNKVFPIIMFFSSFFTFLNMFLLKLKTFFLILMAWTTIEFCEWCFGKLSVADLPVGKERDRSSRYLGTFFSLVFLIFLYWATNDA